MHLKTWSNLTLPQIESNCYVIQKWMVLIYVQWAIF